MHMLGRNPTNLHLLYTSTSHYSGGFWIAEIPDWHYHYGEEDARVKALTDFWWADALEFA